MVNITKENIAKVSPVRKRADIGYAIAIFTTGRKLPKRPIIFDTSQTITSALYIRTQTAAATSETPESKNISGPPSSVPVRSSSASNGNPQKTNIPSPVTLIETRF